MRRLLQGFVVVLALSLVAATMGNAETPRARGDGDTGRQILVMLRLQSEHYRAEGGFGGGYGAGAARVARRRIAERLADAHGLKLVDNWPMPIIGVDCFILSAPVGQALDAAVAALSQDRDVSWAQPLQAYHTLASRSPPNDPLWKLQPAASAWRLADLHGLSAGRGVRVAVIDSRVDAGHPDLKGQVDASQDFVIGHPDEAEVHGTAVAGVIAAIADNAVGIAGIAPGAKVMALRACWQGPADSGATCDSLSLAKALQFAIDHGARVINLSLGGPPDRLLALLIDAALSRRIAVVAATDPQLPHGGFPASCPGVVAVTDDPDRRHDPTVIFAPGRDIPTTKPGARWSMVNGSSFSAAHVSGLLALMLERSRPQRPIRLARAADGGIDAYATLAEAIAAHP